MLRLSLIWLFSIHACICADVDHDSIPDDWETKGVTVSFNDGTTRFLNLPERGASPRHRDLIVWIVWMEGNGHSHKPTANTHKDALTGLAIEQSPLERIVTAFHDAPFVNDDGAKGINLIPFYSEKPAMPDQKIIGTTNNGVYTWQPLEDLAASQIPTGPPGILNAIRICYFVHQMGGERLYDSGLTKGIPGRSFLVSLGATDSQTGSADQQEGTFMHELGHNLGLHHGGADETLFKPNYLSVLNYLFQVTGLMKDGTLGHFDFSRWKIDFDEHNVDGHLGVSQNPELAAYGSAERCLGSTYRYFPKLSAPIRWDCTENDPDPGVRPRDVNRNNTIESLNGWEDWITVDKTGFGSSPPALVAESAMTGAELDVRHIPLILASLTVPKLSAERQPEGIKVTWGRVPLDSVLAYEVLRSRPGVAPVVIRQTKTTEFTDTTAVPGVRYDYRVRLIINGVSTPTIDRVKLSLSNVESLVSASIASILPQKHVISETLMRARPSKVASATR
jgi:hypothetical protein